MSEAPQLNYSPPPPMLHRRVFRRWVYAFFVFLIIASGWCWMPPILHRVELLYWQHRCMDYTPSAGQLVFDTKSGNGLVPVEWSHFYTLLSPPGFRSLGTLFLHAMEDPKGEKCLVAVDLEQSPPLGFRPVVVVRVFWIKSFLAVPVEVTPNRQVAFDALDWPDWKRSTYFCREFGPH